MFRIRLRRVVKAPPRINGPHPPSSNKHFPFFPSHFFVPHTYTLPLSEKREGKEKNHGYRTRRSPNTPSPTKSTIDPSSSLIDFSQLVEFLHHGNSQIRQIGITPNPLFFPLFSVLSYFFSLQSLVNYVQFNPNY